MSQISLYSQEENQTMKLEDSETIQIGRGFFQCVDKRVSRFHGEITAIGNQVKIKSCHINPIFYKRVSNDKNQVLDKGSEILLSHSEKFSLMPDQYEFEIRVTVNEETIQKENESNHTKKTADDPISDPERTPSPEFCISNDQTTNEIKQTDQDQNSTSIEPSRKRHLSENENEEENSKKSKQMSSNSICESSAQETASGEINSDSTVKDIGFLKLIPAGTLVIKPDPDTESPSPSIALLGVIKTEAPEAPTNVETRPSCEHGIRCYRNTLEHKQEFAHVSDVDYRRPDYPAASSDKPDCAFWSSCYRRNPEHFNNFKHPLSNEYTTRSVVPVITTNALSDNDVSDDDSQADQNFEAGNNEDEGSDESIIEE